MRQHGFGSLRTLTLVLAVLSLVPVLVSGQTSTDGRYVVPRTVDGQPDLQGVWANNTATPMERPAALEGKDALTDEELALLKERAAEARGDEQAGKPVGPVAAPAAAGPGERPGIRRGYG